MAMFQVVVLLLILLASVAVPIVIHLRTRARQREETARLVRRIEQSLGGTVMLLEVRDYYEQTSAALKNMLQEAYREGNRFRQDQIRKLIERLDTLKARALDKTMRVLGAEGRPNSRRRRRRGGRSRRRGEARPSASQGPAES